VTLNNLQIAPFDAKGANALLAMDATAKTFRYLDPEEIAQQRAAAAKSKQGVKK
jgi:type IV pilus assembly protein PilO